MDCGTSHHRKRRREFIHFYFQIFMGVDTSNPTILQYHGIVHGKFSEIFSSPGHRPPPSSGTPPHKVLSSRPILMKQKLKDRSWSKLSFGEKKIEKVFNYFQKIKNKIFKKLRILAWMFFFFSYESENYKKPKIVDF